MTMAVAWRNAVIPAKKISTIAVSSSGARPGSSPTYSDRAPAISRTGRCRSSSCALPLYRISECGVPIKGAGTIIAPMSTVIPRAASRSRVVRASAGVAEASTTTVRPA